MAIRIIRNDAGNCVNFVGTSNPTYWNACLSAVVNENNSNNINIINDVRTSTSEETIFEFFNVPYTDFADADGVLFNNAQEAAEYITEKANVLGTDSGIDLALKTVGFGLDATSTSIIMDNGFEFNVNSIKAVATSSGLISINPILGDRVLFKNLEHTNVTDLNGNAITGGLQDVVNYLNELFTVGAFEQIVIADPYSTMVADVDGVDAAGSNIGANVVDPIGTAIMGSSASHYNAAGWKSDDSLNQPGEYFTFDIRVTDSMGFGFILDQGAEEYGVDSYADPATFCDISKGNNAAWGYYWSHWFHSGNKGPWTYYGQRPNSSIRPGWAGFGTSDERANYIADNPIKMKAGIDANGFMVVSYYDVSESTFIEIQKSSYKLLEGQTVKLGIKVYGTRGELYSLPKKHLLEDAAPTMYFRYIESPDGVFHYPIFATAEEANYYDEIHNGLTAGTGQSHTHTYVDDPTNSTWYMPEASHDPTSYTFSTAPGSTTFNGNAVTYTTITSLTNADLTPTPFSATNLTQEEGTNVNIQVAPAGASWSTSVSISPSGSGLVFDGYSLVQGTLTDIGADTTYTITVVRANSYGSSTGSMTVTATDVTPVPTNVTPWTKALDFSGSNEYLKQVTQSTGSNAIRMSGLSQLASANSDSSKTSSDTYSRPWATAVVFQTPNNNTNQHIWNSGEGAGTGDDNIYLRMTGANGELYFGWGREGVGYNEYHIGNFGGSYNQSTGQWWGIYIAHDGTRLNSANATAANLVNAFDIRLMGTNDTVPVFDSLYDVGNDVNKWTSTGVRMDRTIGGDFTIGGRGGNRSFHGKVASMIVTTLRKGFTKPTDAEIKLMLTDPIKWEDDYKDGQYARYSYTDATFAYGPSNSNSKFATQIWLMGDGTSDSYANGIRNHVDPTDQNYTKLQLNSMVSNDIQTVNINGLT